MRRAMLTNFCTVVTLKLTLMSIGSMLSHPLDLQEAVALYWRVGQARKVEEFWDLTAPAMHTMRFPSASKWNPRGLPEPMCARGSCSRS